MKSLLVFILVLLFAHNLYAQNADSIKTAADSTAKAFAWDIEKVDKGTLMFLDVPYQNSSQLLFL